MTVRTPTGRGEVFEAGPLTLTAAEEWLHRTCFRPGPAGGVGLEVELHPVLADDPATALPGPRVETLARELTAAVGHGGVTLEPGGQVELSLNPRPGLVEALEACAADLTVARQVARAAGMCLLGAGVSPFGARSRILDLPRYVAMEAYFDPRWPAGRVMMTSTASVQVNVEASVPGEDPGSAGRWWLLHLVGPALVAAFANSPLRDGRSTGWKSTRQVVWSSIDSARTATVAAGREQDPRTAFAGYALAAPVMMVRRPAGAWQVPSGLSFADWIAGYGLRRGLGRPTLDDLAYHLTTLFPPVRPRGFLEVRYLDAQPARWWRVAAAVVWALAEDRRAGAEAASVAEPVDGHWGAAARAGPADPALRRAAAGCLVAARDSLCRAGIAGPAAEVDAFLTRYTERGRCPGDDLLDGLLGTERTDPAQALSTLEVLP
jgi:glutamate--cysteine ligase